MIKHKRSKRIYYIPGIIALAIAPIIFVVQTNKYLSYREAHCLSIVYGDYSANEIEFTKRCLLAKRNYQIYRLVGNQIKDSTTLILIENFARGINLSKNDSIGLKVILDNRIKYKTYIDLLNACLKSQINTWIPLSDTLFIFNKNYPKDYNNEFCQNMFETNIMECGSDLLSIEKEIKPTLMQKIKNEQFKIKLAIPFAILILIFIYFNIKKIKNEG